MNRKHAMKPVIKWTALALAVCLPLSAQAHLLYILILHPSLGQLAMDAQQPILLE